MKRARVIAAAVCFLVAAATLGPYAWSERQVDRRRLARRPKVVMEFRIAVPIPVAPTPAEIPEAERLEVEYRGERFHARRAPDWVLRNTEIRRTGVDRTLEPFPRWAVRLEIS